MIQSDFSREQALVKQGFSFIGGIDEVGRGCWAGPVVAGCVIFPSEMITADELPAWVSKLRDSKTLSAKQRELLESEIKNSTSWAIGESTVEEIDTIGIGKATQLAMERAVLALTQSPDYLLFDGRESIKQPIKQEAIIDGDALSRTIAAASIIAKNYRDRLMASLDIVYPNYGFARHVGYGTTAHIAALNSQGVSAIHRRSYKPIQKFLRSSSAAK